MGRDLVPADAPGSLLFGRTPVFLTCLLAALVGVTSSAVAQNVLFTEAFDTQVPQVFQAGPVGATGWTFVRDEPNQSDIRFGFDYSTLQIPEAPNSMPGDAVRLGGALRTNVSAGAIDQAGIYYEDASFTGRYQVKVDMWLSWAADPELIGTTEHAGLFVGKATAANPANPGFPASTGAGAIFSSDGDCSNCDHILLKNAAELDTFSGQYSVTDFGFGNQNGFDNTDVNTNEANGALVDLPALLPEFTIPGTSITQPRGTVGYRWVTITADVDTGALGAGAGSDLGTATFSLTVAETGESYVLGTVDNSVMDDPNDGIDTGEAAVDMSGRVTLSIIDFFTSVAGDIDRGVVIFDNLMVTAIEGGLDGDYNFDNVVDAADYTVWRDGDSPDSTMAGYDLWANNYGATTTPATSAVPEPGGVALLWATVLAASAGRMRAVRGRRDGKED